MTAEVKRREDRAVQDGSILRLRSLSKTFEKSSIECLKDISLDVAPSEFLCIFGPNGCGKTTLLNLIAGFKPYFPPSAGEIRMNGDLVQGPSCERVMVFQEDSLFPWLTVEGNIEFGLKTKGVAKSLRREIAEHYIALMGVSDFRGAHPFELSGGMKQKVELARAFAVRPKVLLLDEPFAKVDAITRYSLQEELLRVSDLEKTTIILVTHSVQEAVFLGDRICVMTRRPGTILEQIAVELPEPRTLSDTVNEKRYSSLVSHLLGLSKGGGSVASRRIA